MVRQWLWTDPHRTTGKMPALCRLGIPALVVDCPITSWTFQKLKPVVDRLSSRFDASTVLE